MAQRITKKQLHARVDLLNDLFGYDREAYSGNWGNISANVGTYLLDFAYGGVRLSQIAATTGGERNMSPRLNKSQLYDVVNAYIAGAEAMKKHKQ